MAKLRKIAAKVRGFEPWQGLVNLREGLIKTYYLRDRRDETPLAYAEVRVVDAAHRLETLRANYRKD